MSKRTHAFGGVLFGALIAVLGTVSIASAQSNVWRVSKASGDIFSFLVEKEGLSFPEAVERLAQEAGLPMPVMSEADREREVQRASLYDVMEMAAKFFEETLAGRGGAKARGYLADRQLTSPTQIKFRLGYAPNERFALKEHLGKQGVSVPDMVEAGLLISGDDIPVPYDRFRDRVMFPITDIRGRVMIEAPGNSRSTIGRTVAAPSTMVSSRPRRLSMRSVKT